MDRTRQIQSLQSEIAALRENIEQAVRMLNLLDHCERFGVLVDCGNIYSYVDARIRENQIAILNLRTKLLLSNFETACAARKVPAIRTIHVGQLQPVEYADFSSAIPVKLRA